MKNQEELEKLFPPFKQMLNQNFGKASGSSIEREFLKWWVEIAYEDYVRVEYTDAKGDGKIDAVVLKANGQYIVIQSKYNNAYSESKSNVIICPQKDWEPFDTIAIPAFQSIQKFNSYLKTQTIPPDKKMIYQKVFEEYQKDPTKIKFEFITTHDRPHDLENRLAFLDPINFQAVNSIMSLFQLQRNFQSPAADDLDLIVNPNNVLTKSDTDFKIISYVTEIKLKEIIQYMKIHYPEYHIISKNVRTQLRSGKGSINENIRLTYENKPKEFWYSHNGITILCEELSKTDISSTKQKFTLHMPNIINGAQTVFTLREVLTNKINNDASVLVKIFEIEHNQQSDELIKNIIFRTNQQNAIFWHNLRANEPTQYQLAKYFLPRDVFYERRQNEAKLNKSKIQAGSLATINIQEMAQILEICKDGPDGIIMAVQKKSKLFENEVVFDDLFSIELEYAFFQFVLYRLIQTLVKNLQKVDSRYVMRTIFSVIYETINDPKLLDDKTYLKWINLVDDNRYILNHKTNPNRFKKLTTICKYLFQLCETERKRIKKQRGKNTGAERLSIFIKELSANQEVFKRASKRSFGKKKLNLKNEIIKEFKIIFEDVEKELAKN